MNYLPILEKKPSTQGWGYTILKTILDFLIFFTLPWKFQTKQSSTLEIPQNCVRSLGNSNSIEGQKPRPLEIPHYFFGAIALSYPPFCYWWLIMKKGSWNLYRSPNNPNPKGGGYESAIPIAPPFFLGHPWKFHFTFY